MSVTIKFKRLSPTAKIPCKAHPTDSGMDIRADEGVILMPHSYDKVGTGIAAEIPEGYEIQVRPRSGLAAKNGIVAAFGTVDADYRGEIGVVLYNHSDDIFDVDVGDRIAQLVVCPVLDVQVEETRELGETARGTNGFGSTGVS